MRVIVDTCVWSVALRRDGQSKPADELRRLVEQGLVQMIGPIRQEILSGIRDRSRYVKLRDALRSYPDLTLEMDDFELAAEYFNTCRGKGVPGSNTDFLICSAAARRGLSVFTTDADFRGFQKHVPVRLHGEPMVAG